MKSKMVQDDPHLISAGECFMFLRCIESSMRDLVVLREGGRDMRRRYNAAVKNGSFPEDFARRRLELSKFSFGDLKNCFLDIWPQWKEEKTIHEAIERTVIFRNGFGHANVQPFRLYLLYTPNENAWKSINKYMRCHKCRNYLKDCQCSQENFGEPRSLKFPCLDEKFRETLYGDIKTIDLECFVPTAKLLSVTYNGMAWETKEGYEFAENLPSEPT